MRIYLFKEISGDLIINDLCSLLLTNDNAPSTSSGLEGFKLCGTEGQFTTDEVIASHELQSYINSGDIIIKDENGYVISNLSYLRYYFSYEVSNILTEHINERNPHNTRFNDLLDKPTTLSGYGITDVYTKTESDQRYLPINTFDTLINTNGINNNGGITATTFYGNIDWSYILNVPSFSDINHNHNDLYYTKSESDNRYLLLTGGIISGNLSVNGDFSLSNNYIVNSILNNMTDNSPTGLVTQYAIKNYIDNKTTSSFVAGRNGVVVSAIDLLCNNIATSTTPIVVPKNMRILASFLAISSNGTCTASVLVNGNIVLSLSLVNSNSTYSTHNIFLNAGDKLRFRITSVTGSINSPQMGILLTEI